MGRLNFIAKSFVTVLFLSGPMVAPPSSTVDVTFEVREQSQLDMAEWAMSRFAEAGLDLPSMLIRFPGRDSSLCDGIQGRTFLSADPVEIRMCWEDEFILLHELAHVWESNSFPESKRQKFMEMRSGVRSWADEDVNWGARGREHAANVVAWGLLDDPYPISTTYPNDVASMMEAFDFLTGTGPLHDGGDGIEYPDRTWFERTKAPPLQLGQ